MINKAISDKNGIDVAFYECHSMSTMHKEFLTSISNSIITDNDELNKKMVRTISIDNLVETINIEEITLLKIDIEGAEVLALKGATNTLNKKKIKNMLIEYHSSENYDYMIKALEELGYNVTNLQERFNLRTSDDVNFVNGHIMATLRDSARK